MRWGHWVGIAWDLIEWGWVGYGRLERDAMQLYGSG